jgi:DNA-binding NarL/FixJ family response regulator
MTANGESGASRFLVLGDDTLCREGIRHILKGFPSTGAVDVVDGVEDLEAMEDGAQSFDLVFLSAMRPELEIDDVIAAVKSLVDPTPVAVVGLVDSSIAVRSAISAGATGYVPAMSSPRVIRHAVELMLTGSLYLPASLLTASPGDADNQAIGPGSLVRLTARQEAVLGELAKGRSNKQIATELGLSEATVKVHVAAIMRTLKAHNRTQAVLTASQVGILQET